MTAYEELLQDVLDNGVVRPDRTGTGTLSVFGRQMRFDLRDGFPLITSKKVHWHSIVCELLWMLQGRTDAGWLHDRGVSIWDAWGGPDGELGPVYGAQWRRWGPSNIDQIQGVIKSLQEDRYSRRHIVTAWNPTDLPFMALPPCHMTIQFYVDNDGLLSTQVYQRSADMFLGVPFNIASYALLTHIIAAQAGLNGVRDLVWTGGDVHLYINHIDQAREQLGRDVLPLPGLLYPSDIRSVPISDLKPEHFQVFSYNPHPAIKGAVSV